MATGTFRVYGNALVKMLNKEIDWDSDTLKVMLCTASYSPNQDTHDYKDDITNEVTGTGYSAGGKAVVGTSVYVPAASITTWAGNQAYSVGDVRRPTVSNGHIYRCVASTGSSGSSEPTWPTASGGTVVDGSVTWQEVGRGVLKLDAEDATWAGSTIANVKYAVIYDDTGNAATSALIGYLTFDTEQSSSAGNFTVTWNAGGIINMCL